MCDIPVLLFVASLVYTTLGSSTVYEVSVGDTAVLHCPSNDEKHRFQFWHVAHNNLMIGPTNDYSRNKYKYEVLTGMLTIRVRQTQYKNV